MTVLIEQERDEIEMTEPVAQPTELTLDELFERLERMPVPEGYKVEIIEGFVFMSPQRRKHWKIIEDVLLQLRDHFGRRPEIDVDVRIHFPGPLNGFSPDLAKMAEDAVPDENDRFAPQDLEFVLEVISRGTAPNDYGAKLTAYAAAGVPVYMIADPYTGRCRVFSEPEDGHYERDLTVDFGQPVDLSKTPVELTLSTKNFPREERRPHN